MITIRNSINGLLVAATLSLSVFGQPIAKITGFSKVPPGELTSLSSTGSVGDNLVWIKPEGITVIQAGCEMMDQQLFFSTMRGGVYEFILIVADKEARISYAKHSVTVGDVTSPPPPTDPVPTPVPDPSKWGGLKDISKKNADAANDGPARAQLKAALTSKLSELKKMCESGQCPGLSQAQQIITSTIDNTLLLRSNRFSSWDQWRIGNSNYLKEKVVKDVPDYFTAVESFTAGL